MYLRLVSICSFNAWKKGVFEFSFFRLKVVLNSVPGHSWLTAGHGLSHKEWYLNSLANYFEPKIVKKNVDLSL